MNELEQLQNRIEELENWKLSMEKSFSIPLEIQQSFKKRFIDPISQPITLSTKSVDSEDITINEAGAATKVALDDPDAFLQLKVGTTTYYLPAYTS